MIENNVKTDFCPECVGPQIDPSAYVHPLAAVIGAVTLGRRVYVAPAASVRGDEGHPLYVGNDSNIQDGVVIHALETFADGHPVPKNLVDVGGKAYAVYVGDRVSLAHQAQIHGPAAVLNDTFVGMRALVFRATVGEGCVVEPGAILMGVRVPAGRIVPAGAVIRLQDEADALPVVTDDYPLKTINRGVVHVNTALATAYGAERRSVPRCPVGQAPVRG